MRGKKNRRKKGKRTRFLMSKSLLTCLPTNAGLFRKRRLIQSRRRRATKGEAKRGGT